MRMFHILSFLNIPSWDVADYFIFDWYCLSISKNTCDETPCSVKLYTINTKLCLLCFRRSLGFTHGKEQRQGAMEKFLEQDPQGSSLLCPKEQQKNRSNHPDKVRSIARLTIALSTYTFHSLLFSRYVWTWGRNTAFQHDAFYCMLFKGSVPFPTKRLADTPNNFVASVVTTNFIMLRKCPVECRPKDHIDWEYCWRRKIGLLGNKSTIIAGGGYFILTLSKHSYSSWCRSLFHQPIFGRDMSSNVPINPI